MQDIALFADAGTKTAPPAGTITSGYFPLQVLPAEQLNYYLNGSTQAIQEWVNLITLAGLTPGPTQQGWTAISGLMASGFTFTGPVVVPDAALAASPATFAQAKNTPEALYNLGLSASVSANALTIALKQSNGTSDPSTGASMVEIGFRSSTITSGAQVKRQVTAALSLTIPSGATMGFTAAMPDKIHVYALDNAGTVELAVSTEDLWDSSFLWDTTVMNTSSDSRTVLYSGSARTGVSIRYLGTVFITEATPGTWATAPSRIALNGFGVRSGIVSASASSGATVALTTATPADIVSVTIPPGTWDISTFWGFVPSSTTSITVVQLSVSQTSATVFAGGTAIPNRFTGELTWRPNTVSPLVYGDGQTRGLTGPTYRVEFQTATTLYLVVNATFPVSTLAAFGWIQARRVAVSE